MTSGVGSIEELSNVVTGSPFQINGDANTYAWVGTPGSSTATETTPEGVVRTNLCTNGSFEYGTTGWGTGTASISQSTDWSDDGGYSLKVTPVGGNNDSFAEMNVSGLTSGATYTISATLRLDADQTGTLEARARSLNLYDGTTQTNATAPNGEGETRLSATIVMASTGLRVRLYNGSPNAAEPAYWDSVLIEKTSTVGEYFDGDTTGYNGAGITAATSGVLLRTNLCPNPSFETNTTTWSNNSTTGVTISRVTSDHYVGTACLQAAQGGTGNTAVASCTAFTTVIGQTYTLSGYVKTATASLSVQAKALTYSGTATTLTTGVWTRYSVTFVATSTSTAGRFVATAGSNSVFNILVDAVQIEVGSTATGYFDGATTDTDTRIYAWTGTANGSTSTETATFTELVSIDTATELDQIVLTRDSNPGTVSLENPDGAIVVFDPDAHRTLPGPGGQAGAAYRVFTDDDYSSIDMAFDMSHIINVLDLTYFTKTTPVGGNKATKKVAHTVTYTDLTSIGKYGRFKPKKPPTIHKKADFADYASKVFARNADPQEVPRSITIPIIKANDLLPGYEDGHFVGHKVVVWLPDGVTSYTCRVARIQHSVTPGKWTVQVFLRDQNVHHHFRSSTLSSEVANNPDKTVLANHIEDDIDGTGKTLHSAVIQSSADVGPGTEGFVFEDDSVGGVLKMYSGVAGENPAYINPGGAPGFPSVKIYSGDDGTTSHSSSITLKGGTSGANNITLRGSVADFGPMTVSGSGQFTTSGSAVFTGGYALSGGGSIDGGFSSNNNITISGSGHSLTISSIPTTANAANVFIGGGGILQQVTSLRSAKVEVELLSDDQIRGLLNVEPVSFFDKGEVDANDGSTEGLRRIPGVIAEDVEAKAPLFATYDEDGNLNGVAYDRIAVALLQVVQRQDARLQVQGRWIMSMAEALGRPVTFDEAAELLGG